MIVFGQHFPGFVRLDAVRAETECSIGYLVSQSSKSRLGAYF